MKEYCILMLIFGVCIFLYGVWVYYAKDPLLFKTYATKMTKEHKKRIGVTLMYICLGPILSGLSALIIDNMLVAFIVLIVTIVIIFIMVNKKYE